MTDPDHADPLSQVASLYYERGRTQEQIGERPHSPRRKASRLLLQAREAGIVRIEVPPPRARARRLERRLRERFGPRGAVIATAPPAADGERLRALAAAAADHLAALRPAPALLGASWGRTLDPMARALEPGRAHGVNAVRVNGTASRSSRPSCAPDTANRIARLGGGNVTPLPVPALVEHGNTRRALAGDRTGAGVLDRAARSDVFLFSPGGIGPGSVLADSGHINAEDDARLAAKGAVGDAMGRFVNAEGPRRPRPGRPHPRPALGGPAGLHRGRRRSGRTRDVRHGRTQPTVRHPCRRQPHSRPPARTGRRQTLMAAPPDRPGRPETTTEARCPCPTQHWPPNRRRRTRRCGPS